MMMMMVVVVVVVVHRKVDPIENGLIFIDCLI